jgi:hypothetical protein
VRLSPGNRVGPYEVLASLGAGGMAEVYRVRDPRLQREVALKVVGDALASDPSFLARLEQEARLAGSLNHPNIVAVHDVGSHDGAPYVVTELLQGETLRQRMTKGQVPLSQALDWTIQMAQGLAAAHEHGVVHRDLKPENVFLTRAGHVKLLDFGIAKAAISTRTPRNLLEPTLSPAGYVTRTGSVLGTPGYMSPEQVRGEPVDARSDIFSLGSILYELLCGHRAFPGATVVESGHAILHTDPAPLPDEVPVPVKRIVSRCLEKDPEQRFQSARDLGFALDVVRSPSGFTPLLIAPGGRGRRLRRGVVLLALASVLGLAAFWAGRRLQTPAVPTVRVLTFRRGSILGARFAPDGRTVHFSAAWGASTPQVYTTTIDSPESRPLGLGDAHLLAVSPSGELALSLRPKVVLFDGAQGTLAQVPAMGGAPHELATDVEYADWAPDGQRLAVARFEGGKSRLEFPLGTVLFNSTGFVSHPRVSPAGDRVAFLDHPVPSDTLGDVTVIRSSGEKEKWGPRFDEVLGLAWMPGGAELLVTGSLSGELDSLWLVRRGPTARLLYRSTGNLLVTDVSSTGRVLAVETDWRQEIAVRTADGRTRPLEWLDWAALSGISDDGNIVLTGEYGKATAGRFLLLVRDLREQAPKQLGTGQPLALSHDGRLVLSERLAEREGDATVLLLHPTGPGKPRVLPWPGLARVDQAAFFRDGKRLALYGRKELLDAEHLYVYNMEDKQLVQISPEEMLGYSALNLSADEQRASGSGADGVVAAFSLNGAASIRIPQWNEDYAAAGWLADGSLVAFQRFALPSHVERVDLRTGKVTALATLSPQDLSGVTRIARVRVTPDGRPSHSSIDG